MNIRIFSALFISLLFFNLGCFKTTEEKKPAQQTEEKASPVNLELINKNDEFGLLLNGEPFTIKGAGLEFGSQENLAEHGANTFRTWRTENGKETGQEVLDRAQKNGLYVVMGLEIARERHGFDYNDSLAVAKQFEEVKKEILKYKDHPALIIWGIGNELNLRATNPKVWNAVNQISEYIHKVDTNHLTTTSLAGIDKKLADQIKERAPDLDLLSIQMYGDLINLPIRMEDAGWDGPFMVTEWGATGHWEVQKTEWGAPIENNSTVKANFYLERYKKAIEPFPNHCLGSFVFLWGQKQERTPTWYGIFLESGEETESVDVMHYIWNGQWPENRTPQVKNLLLEEKTAPDNIKLASGGTFSASAEIIDLDGDPVQYTWDIKPESTDLQDGGDFEKTPKSMPELILKSEDGKVQFKAPEKPGAYRLFVYGFDQKGHAAHANIPFFVTEK
jgi:hypothetical protein